MTSLRLRMLLEDMQIRNLAVNTQESYVQQVSLFARYFNQSPEQLGPEEIRTYQGYLTKEKKLATGSIIKHGQAQLDPASVAPMLIAMRPDPSPDPGVEAMEEP